MAIIRMLTGALVIYHGLEIFDEKIIDGYLTWEVFKKMPGASFLVYLGKALELVSGTCLLLGFFTRTGGIVLAIVMFFICFIIGQGKFWYEDQHPFLLALLGIIFFITGPFALSIDGWRSQK